MGALQITPTAPIAPTTLMKTDMVGSPVSVLISVVSELQTALFICGYLCVARLRQAEGGSALDVSSDFGSYVVVEKVLDVSRGARASLRAGAARVASYLQHKSLL